VGLERRWADADAKALRWIEILDRRVEQVENLPPPSHGLLSIIQGLTEFGDRCLEQRCKEQERNQFARGETQRVVQRQTHGQNHHQHHRGEHVADHVDPSHIRVGSNPGSVAILRSVLDSLGHVRLGSVRANNLGPRKRLAERPQQNSNRCSAVVVCPHHAGLHGAKNRDERQEHCERDQGQGPRVGGHCHERAHNYDGLDQPGEHPPFSESRESIDVARHPRDEHPGVGFVVIGKRQLVHMIKDR